MNGVSPGLLGCIAVDTGRKHIRIRKEANVNTSIETHYSDTGDLTAAIKDRLNAAGKSIEQLKSTDLAGVDEFHIRGREATLELGERMRLTPDSRVLDIGSGLGGPARTLAQSYGCQVTGIDLTQDFCEAATAISMWLGLIERVLFVHGDATDPPFEPSSFDAAMTIHAAMNIPAKDALYASAKRVLKSGSIFAVYDVLQGEGGEVVFPVPWARDPSISHLATPEEMRRLLTGAGFDILEELDSSPASLAWFEQMISRMEQSEPPPVSFDTFLGEDFPQMARNQLRNLSDERIRTVTFICQS